jgi:hypothetical protein
MTWKLSPRSLLWLTNAPEQPRVVHGTRPHKQGLPSQADRVSPPPPDEKKKKKKDHDYQKPRSIALVIAAATGGRVDHNKCPRPQRGSGGSCPIHPNGRHSTVECCEIIDLAKRVSDRINEQHE